MEDKQLKNPMQENIQWKKELALLAEIIGRAPLEKTFKWGSDVYTFQGKNVLSYGGFKNYFALWFYNGVFLSDKFKVLVNAQEGVTKSLRQWRFSSLEEIDETRILEYIFEAVEIEKKGLKIKPQKFVPAEVPAMLKEALDENVELNNSFSMLTPGKQKEYIVYLNEAKQESTRLTRLEKILPLIMSGAGLNDKYIKTPGKM